MLYTRRGDDGTTKTFGEGKGRISKASLIADALGSVDEINCHVGLCKVYSEQIGLELQGESTKTFLHFIQSQLFIVQAELAGAPKKVIEDSVKKLEAVTDWIESEIPPIKTFKIAGGSKLSAHFDIARTIARRAERAVITAIEGDEAVLGEHSRQFLNRLSSALYALARYVNHVKGIEEEAPKYE